MRSDSKRRPRSNHQYARSVAALFRNRRGNPEPEGWMEGIISEMAPALRLRLAAYCRATGQAEGAVVRTALRHYIETEERLDKLEQSQERVRQRLEDLWKAFGRFMQRCLAASRSPNDRSN